MTILPGGNITQNRDKGGLVKAMVYFNGDGTILRCYNGITGASSGNCGFNATRFGSGFYVIDFGFQVSDRFVSVSVNDIASSQFPEKNVGISFELGASTITIAVYTYEIGAGRSDRPFMVIVY